MPKKKENAKKRWIELFPGVPWGPPQKLNRIARQQGLCLAIAQASVYDEICQAIKLPGSDEQKLISAYLVNQGVNQQEDLEPFLQSKGWNNDDLVYFSTKGARIDLFKQQAFGNDVELRFLNSKLDLDQVTYSLIRVSDGDLAFELHQRLQEGEASFSELAAKHSEGSERETGGRHGPYPLSQAHEAVAEKLRVSQQGQLWPPFFLKDVWLILRLDVWEGKRLNDETRDQLLEELFSEWLNQRVMQLLNGEDPGPLLHHQLHSD